MQTSKYITSAMDTDKSHVVHQTTGEKRRSRPNIDVIRTSKQPMEGTHQVEYVE